jgi:hypothetical protein
LIDGTGMGSTVVEQQTPNSRVLYAHAVLTPHRSTITGGSHDQGPGLYSCGNLILDQVRITGNSAPVADRSSGRRAHVCADATITDRRIDASTTTGSGGGLADDSGIATLQLDTVADNPAINGTALAKLDMSEGTVTGGTDADTESSIRRLPGRPKAPDVADNTIGW